MKKSFFGRYFLYKFNNMLGIFIASIALALAGIPALITMLKIYLDLYAPYLRGEVSLSETEIWNSSGISMAIAMYCIMWMLVVLAASVVMAAVAPIVSFNHHSSRPLTDTIGSLPLTYNQRFWGDFLAGFAASVAPFLVLIPYILIMAKGVDLYGIEGYDPIFGGVAQYTFLFAIILASAYTFSSMIVSCCGKIGSSVFYALFGTVIIPGVIMAYTGVVCSNALGLDTSTTGLDAISAVAPGGLLPNFFNFWYLFGGYMFFTSFDPLTALTPASYAVILLLTAAYAAGAYFLGKYRKAERIGRDFVYESVYEVMAAIFAVGILGIMLYLDASTETYVWLIAAAVLGLLFYLGLELVHTRSLKKLPRALIKYAAICVVCFGFFVITKLTDGFGLSDVVPSADEISYIEIGGRYFYSYDGDGVVYDDRTAIETIVSEHKKLLSDKSGLQTGFQFRITYKLKNGLEINRQYSTTDDGDKTIEKLSDIIRKLPISSMNDYGILTSEDYSDLRFSGFYNIWTTDEDGFETRESVQFTVDASKNDELKQMLLNDIKYRYSAGDDFAGHLYAVYTKNGVQRTQYFSIYESYEETLAFIKNPDNYSNSIIDSDDDQIRTYTAVLSIGDDYIQVEFSSDSEQAKELISLCGEGISADKSELITIYDDRGFNTWVGRADEKRAAELILQLANKTLD